MPETIQAHITKVEREVDSEWGSIFTDHERVKKLTTKIAEKLAEAARFKKTGELVGIDYTEKTRTVGDRTYRNYYYERAGSLDSNGASPAAAADDGIDVVQPQAQPGRRTDPADAWRMALTSGTERAVQTLPMMPEGQRDFETQKTIARAWAEFIFFTPPPDAAQAAFTTTPAQRPGAYEEPHSHETPPPYGDDDIPY